MNRRSFIQAVSLALFLLLLAYTAFPLQEMPMPIPVPVDIFLRLDPLVVSLMPLLTQSFMPALMAGIGVLILTLFFGRIFCGYICPMGITLDIVRRLADAFLWKKSPKKTPLPAFLSHIKYLFLVGLSAAAFFGINHIFWGSPMALITRFYTLLLHPLLLLGGNTTLSTLRPFFQEQGFVALSYAQISPRLYQSVYFVAAFFLCLFILEKIRPRFWCQFICPAGAILALLSRNPWWKRRVYHCTECMACQKHCPSGALGQNPRETNHAACLTCQKCASVCPQKGIRFSIKADTKHSAPLLDSPLDTPLASHLALPAPQAKAATLPSRRAFLGATLTGAGMAALAHLNATSPIPATAKASLAQLGCVRPPGALPEADFLTRCLRCGQCMKVCPTNALQPAWLCYGFEGIFSPVVQARMGGCEPECQACGQVCPTAALLPLPLEDKRQAKIGTAVIYPELCLAWEQGRSCVVCQEVCPYGAIELKGHKDTKIPVPIITENRCYGCGFCEMHCPVHIPAIAIQPLNALRLPSNTYAEAAKAAGLDLRPVSLRLQDSAQENSHNLYENSHQEFSPDQLPPGFSDE